MHQFCSFCSISPLGSARPISSSVEIPIFEMMSESVDVRVFTYDSGTSILDIRMLHVRLRKDT